MTPDTTLSAGGCYSYSPQEDSMKHPVMWFEVLGRDVTLGVFEDPEGHAIGLVEARA